MVRIKICKEPDCKDAASTEGYCRLHYLKHWRRIRKAKKIASARKLNNYIEHICKENPDGYLEAIRRDLRSKNFPESVDEAFGEEDRFTQAVTLFALLELHRRGDATWEQAKAFGPIEIRSLAP